MSYLECYNKLSGVVAKVTMDYSRSKRRPFMYLELTGMTRNTRRSTKTTRNCEKLPGVSRDYQKYKKTLGVPEVAGITRSTRRC
jgi:hypothetical protein